MRWLVTPLIIKNEPVPQGTLGPSPSLSAFLHLLLLLTLGHTAEEHLVFSIAARRALSSSLGCQRCKGTPAHPRDEGRRTEGPQKLIRCQEVAPCHEATLGMRTRWRAPLLLVPRHLESLSFRICFSLFWEGCLGSRGFPRSLLFPKGKQNISELGGI